MKIANLAALKRLPEGTKVVLVSAKHKGKNPDGTMTDWLEVDHRAKNIERTINKMQTNAIRFSPIQGQRMSWLYFPPAKFFEATEKGFRLLPQNEWDAILEYEVIG